MGEGLRPLGSPFDIDIDIEIEIELPSEDDISDFWQQCWDVLDM